MKKRYKVGDYLIGTSKPNEYYGITHKGTICVITALGIKQDGMDPNLNRSAEVVVIYSKSKSRTDQTAVAEKHKLRVRQDFVGFKKISMGKAMAYVL
jgi:hypothetical protein